MSIRTEEQEHSVELHLARDYCGRESSRQHVAPSFLYLFLSAFSKADRFNFDMLRTVAMRLLNKYRVECTCSEGEPDRLTIESLKWCRECKARNPSSGIACVSCGSELQWSGIPL